MEKFINENFFAIEKKFDVETYLVPLMHHYIISKYIFYSSRTCVRVRQEYLWR